MASLMIIWVDGFNFDRLYNILLLVCALCKCFRLGLLVVFKHVHIEDHQVQGLRAWPDGRNLLRNSLWIGLGA